MCELFGPRFDSGHLHRLDPAATAPRRRGRPRRRWRPMWRLAARCPGPLPVARAFGQRVGRGRSHGPAQAVDEGGWLRLRRLHAVDKTSAVLKAGALTLPLDAGILVVARFRSLEANLLHKRSPPTAEPAKRCPARASGAGRPSTVDRSSINVGGPRQPWKTGNLNEIPADARARAERGSVTFGSSHPCYPHPPPQGRGKGRKRFRHVFA